VGLFCNIKDCSPPRRKERTRQTAHRAGRKDEKKLKDYLTTNKCRKRKRH